MALKELVLRISGDTAGLTKALNEAQKGLGDTIAKSDKLGEALKKVGKDMTLWVTAPIAGMGLAAVKSSADMEMLQASFTTMLGSGAAGKAMMDDLIKMAASTPFATEDLARASKTLLQFGLDGASVIPTLSMLGDVAGGNAERMNSLSLAFGKVSSQGKMTGENLMMMIDAGFNPLKLMADELADKTGKTIPEAMAAMQKAMAAGKISTEMVTDAFKKATSEGGAYYKGMETASKTLSGLLSTLGDDAASAGRSMVESFIPFIKDGVKALSGLAQGLAQMSPTQKGITLAFVGLAAAIGPVTLGIGGLITAIGTIKTALAGLGLASAATPIGMAIAALAIFAGGLALSAENAEKAKKNYSDLQQVMAGRSTGNLEQDLEIINKKIKDNDLAMKYAIANKEKYGGMVADISKLEAESVILRKQADDVLSRVRATAQDKQGQEALSKTVKETTTAFEGLKGIGEKIAVENKAADVADDEYFKNAARRVIELRQLGKEDFESLIIEEEKKEEFFQNDATRVIAMRQLKKEASDEQITAAQEVANISKDSIKIMDDLFWAVVRLGAEEALEGIHTLATALFDGSLTAIGFVESIGNILHALLDALPGMLLSAALTAIIAQNWGLGLTLLAAAGVAAIGGALVDVIGGFAEGTTYSPGGVALVGERGPELVNLPAGSTVTPNGMTPNQSGGGTTINFYSPTAIDVVQADAMLRSSMRQMAFSGGL